MLDVTDLVGQPFEKYPCWELVKEVFRRRGETLPDYLTMDYSNPADIKGVKYYEKLSSPEEGAICAFDLGGHGIDHVGVYLGNNMLLHSTTVSGVCIERFSRYVSRLKGIYRYGTCNHNHEPI